MPRYNVLQCPDTRRYTATKHSDTMQRYKAVNGSAKQNLPYSFMKSELKIMDGGGESMLSSIIPSGLAFWPWPACPEGYGDGPTRTRAPWGRRAAEHAQAEGSNGARPLPGLGVSPRADGSLSQEYLRKLAGCVGSVRRKGVRAPSPGVGAQRSGGYNFHWQVRVPGNLPSAASRPREQPRTDGTAAASGAAASAERGCTSIAIIMRDACRMRTSPSPSRPPGPGPVEGFGVFILRGWPARRVPESRRPRRCSPAEVT